MTFLVVLLCCLAAAVVGIALRGPERWHKRVRAQIRPGAPEPTESGYRLLFWRNWFVALVLVALAVVAIDGIRLSDTELREAADRAVNGLDGTTGQINSDTIEAVVESAVDRDLAVRELDRDEDAEATDPYRYEVVRGDSAADDVPAELCVEVQRVSAGGVDPVLKYSYVSVNPGACT